MGGGTAAFLQTEGALRGPGSGQQAGCSCATKGLNYLPDAGAEGFASSNPKHRGGAGEVCRARDTSDVAEMDAGNERSTSGTPIRGRSPSGTRTWERTAAANLVPLPPFPRYDGVILAGGRPACRSVARRQEPYSKQARHQVRDLRLTMKKSPELGRDLAK